MSKTPSKLEHTQPPSSSPLTSQHIAASCGNIVTTWGFNQSSTLAHNTFEPFHKTDFGNGRASIIPDIAWNHNGHVIASCSDICQDENNQLNVALNDSHSGILLDSFSTNKKSSSQSKKTVSFSSQSKCTSVSFGGKSRYLSISSTDGTVAVWDLKKKARVRLFHAHNGGNMNMNGLKSSVAPVSKACFDPTDTYVAALSNSSKDSSLRIFKLRESLLQSIHEPPAESHGGGTSMEFSPIQTNQVAVGMNDGTLMLWDISISHNVSNSSNFLTQPSASSLIFSITNPHTSKITGLAFCAMDKPLLASSSSDGSIAFHDINSKKTIQSISPSLQMSTNDSLEITCLDLHADGVTCAAGTSTGHVLLYDLRNTNSDVPLSAHLLAPNDARKYDVYPVNSLRFFSRFSSASASTTVPNQSTIAKQYRGENDGRTKLLHTKSKQLDQSLYFTNEKKYRTEPEPRGKNSKMHNHDSFNTNTSSNSEDFSLQSSHPPKPTLPQHLEMGEDQSSSSLPPYTTSLTPNGSSNKSSSNHLKKSTLPNSSQYSFHEQFAFLESFQKKSPTPTTNRKKTRMEISSLKKNHSMNASEAKFSNFPQQFSAQNSDVKSRQIKPIHDNHGGRISGAQSPLNSQRVSSVESNTKAPDVNDNDGCDQNILASYSSSPNDGRSTLKKTESGIDESHKNENGECSENDIVVSDFKDLDGKMLIDKMVIQKMINDSIDNLRDDVQISLHNIHVDMLRQFQSQSDEIQNLFNEQKSMMKMLINENQSLREENERLKSNPY